MSIYPVVKNKKKVIYSCTATFMKTEKAVLQADKNQQKIIVPSLSLVRK